MNPESQLPSQPKYSEQEALEIQKEVFMTSRGMKVGQSRAEYLVESEDIWNRMHPKPEATIAVDNNESDDIHNHAVESAKIKDEEALVKVRQELGLDLPTEESTPELGLEQKRKLSGWTASYELAKIALREKIDLSKLSREDYAEYAIKNSLAIDDDQLRMAPWQRMGTSVENVIGERKKMRSEIKEETDKAFNKFSFEMKEKADQADSERLISERIKVRQGTKDSNSWLFFGINNSLSGNRAETFKSYASVKDLNTLTPDRFISFMKALRDEGYNGDIKIFQELAFQGSSLNDQIVMHGASEKDSKLALVVAEKFWGDDLAQKGIGKDETVDGKEKSYSQILADRIKERINKGK